MKRFHLFLPFIAFSLILFCAFLFLWLAHTTVQSSIGSVFSIALIDSKYKLPGSSFDCIEHSNGATCTQSVDERALTLTFDYEANDGRLWSDSYGTCSVTYNGNKGDCRPHASYNFRSSDNHVPLILLTNLPKFNPAKITSAYQTLQLKGSFWILSANILSFSLALTFARFIGQLLKLGKVRGFLTTRFGALTAMTLSGFFVYFSASFFLTITLLRTSIVD